MVKDRIDATYFTNHRQRMINGVVKVAETQANADKIFMVMLLSDFFCQLNAEKT
jgi:hypothetical protein